MVDLLFSLFRDELKDIYPDKSEVDIKQEVFVGLLPDHLKKTEMTYSSFKFGGKRDSSFIQYL